MLQMRFQVLSVWVVLSMFGLAAVCYAQDQGSAKAAPKLKVKKEMFLGVWFTSRIPGAKTFVNADNTYEVQSDKGDTIDGGKWFVRDDEIVWKSKDFTPWEEDANPVLKYTPDKFLIRELDESTTTFTRDKSDAKGK